METDPGASDNATQDGEAVHFMLRDINPALVAAWNEVLGKYSDRITISHGDIFNGAPGADALVSPANSFGYMDGGIDLVYSRHFGWQLHKRLQAEIKEQHDGELLVGCAHVIPTFDGGAKESSMDWSQTNEGRPIKYLISAPTMRLPMNVSNTVNAYLAFRAVILAVKKHNSIRGNDQIKSVLCPGLATAVGKLPPKTCAYQMLHAFLKFDLEIEKNAIIHDEITKDAVEHLQSNEGTETTKLRAMKRINCPIF